jgi:hypothetical protein
MKSSNRDNVEGTFHEAKGKDRGALLMAIVPQCMKASYGSSLSPRWPAPQKLVTTVQ